MNRSSIATPPLYRLVDVTGATAALLFLSPLLVLTLVATLLARRQGTVAGFLHRSGLADLPKLFEVVEGRRSLIGTRAAMEADVADQPQPSEVPARPAAAQTVAEAGGQIIAVESDLDIIGQHFRKCFKIAASAEFDDLLRAIDGGQGGFGRPAVGIG